MSSETYINAFIDEIHLSQECKDAIKKLASYTFEGKDVIKHISFGIIRDVVGSEIKDHDILEIIQFLSIGKLPIWIVNYQFEENGSIYEVTKDDVFQAEVNGFFIHPINGNEVHDYKKIIRLYFVPNLLFINELLK